MNTGSKVSTSSSWGGGAVCVRYNGTFEMAGGKIVNNTAAGEGGAVSVANNGNFKMTAGEISGNTAGRGSVMAFFRGTYTNNGVTISLDIVDGQRVITITDAEGNNLEYVLDVDDGSRITAGDIPKGMNLYYWDKVLQLIAPVPETPETPETPDVPDSVIIPDADALLTGGSAGTTTIEDEETPLAGLVSVAQLLEELHQYEAIEDVELPEDFQWIDHEYAQAIYWGLDEALVVDTEDDPLDPDEIVTVALLREVLENFVEYKGADLTVTVDGEDDMIVMDLGERLTVFYGELEAALEAQAA